jgi:hypothetical protein|tara:strand:+ start:180 stop:320 length:141 start_codon:yes stop_codon:yes gene_type:complete
MDGITVEQLNHKLETTLEIVMEHFVEMEERMEDLETDIEDLRNGTN